MSSAVIEPDPVPMEDVIEAVVAEDTSAQAPGTNHGDMNAGINKFGNEWIHDRTTIQTVWLILQ